MEQKITFDRLPEVVAGLVTKVSLLIEHVTNQNPSNIEEQEKFFGVEVAAKELGLTVPTIYTKVSRRELKCMKKGGRLYFSNIDLKEYLKSGYRKTNVEIQQEADAYILNNKKRSKNA
jgi:excisionase family DNA binding protein